MTYFFNIANFDLKKPMFHKGPLSQLLTIHQFEGSRVSWCFKVLYVDALLISCIVKLVHYVGPKSSPDTHNHFLWANEQLAKNFQCML